jgi:hypothetical protein
MLLEPASRLHHHQDDAEAFSFPHGDGVAPSLLPLLLLAQPRNLGLEIEALERAVHLSPGSWTLSCQDLAPFDSEHSYIMTNLVIDLGEPWLIL